MNADFVFGDVSRNISPVYSFGSPPDLFSVFSGLFFMFLWMVICDWSPHPYPISVPCFFSCYRYTLYLDFHFSGIPLNLISIPMLNWFRINPNVDVGNAIFPSIIFPVNDDVIKDCLKYFLPYPMISHVIPWMVSSSYMSGCSS